MILQKSYHLTKKDSKLRLAEMGLMPGVQVRMIKKTPFGGPVLIKINNYYLTLRKEDASFIFIIGDYLYERCFKNCDFRKSKYVVKLLFLIF